MPKSRVRKKKKSEPEASRRARQWTRAANRLKKSIEDAPFPMILDETKKEA